MNEFNQYYEKYLDLKTNVIDDNNYLISCTNLRDEPINKKYFYLTIITEYNNRICISVSKNNYKSFKQLFEGSIKLTTLDEIYLNLKQKNLDSNIRRMYRMTMDLQKKFNLKKSNKFECIYLNEYRKYAYKFNNKIISYCKISNTFHDFGNIVIWTDEQYRRQGLAEYLLSMVLTKCIELNIKPVYVVDINNIPSINLAIKMGFYIRANEIIISEEKYE